MPTAGHLNILHGQGQPERPNLSFGFPDSG